VTGGDGDAAGDVVEGEVVRRMVGTGSKSEREAVVLDTPERSYLLRRREGNPFADPVLDQLVGQRLRLVGTALDTTFVIDEWAPTNG
jgi:hypothetical protein